MESSGEVRSLLGEDTGHTADLDVWDGKKEGDPKGNHHTQPWPTLQSTLQAPKPAQNRPVLPAVTPSPWNHHVLHKLAPPLSPSVRLLSAVALQEKLRADFQKHVAQSTIKGNDAAASSTAKNNFPTSFTSVGYLGIPFEERVQRPLMWGDGSQTGSEGSSIQKGLADLLEGGPFFGGIHGHQAAVTSSPGTCDFQGYKQMRDSNYTGQYSHAHANQVVSGWNPPAPSLTPPFGFRNGWQTSPNYKGNPCLPGNQSADIPEQESCSLWITNLNLSREHPEHELLAHIRGCGKVYACVVNPPEKNGGHTTSAAKVVFFHVSGARELLRQARAGEFVINGYVPKVVHNRIRTKSRDPGPECRVIHIEGPKTLVDEPFLTLWFANRFVFQTDGVSTLSEDGGGPNGRRRLEWRFASYRCQASAAVQFIDKERRRGLGGLGQQSNLWRNVNTFYALDPCA
jgi:hypothetical protein